MSKHAVMPLTDYVNACNILREKTGTTEAIKSGDIPEKVNEVYDAGKIAVLKESQYMNGKESGTIVSVNDVTPIEHNVGVKVSSDTITDFTGVEVARYGKNLLLATDFYKNQSQYSQLVEDGRNCVRFIDGTAFKYEGLTFEEKTQYTVSFWCKTVTRSGGGDATSRFFVFYYTNGTKSIVQPKATNGEWVYVSFTSSIDSGKSISHIGMDSVSYKNWLYVDIDTFQLEKNTTATEYEPYTETIYTANADGTVEGVKSISPNMTLIPNNNAVTVECEYLRDIDLYIDNLLKSVAMIGGE